MAHDAAKILGHNVRVEPTRNPEEETKDVFSDARARLDYSSK
jgi:hypothetical protein